MAPMLLQRIGAVALGLSGILWAIDAGGEELAWCGLFGLGFLGLGAALLSPAPRRPAVAAAGLAVAAVGATHWMAQPLGAGDVGSPWALFGIGTDLAFAAALALWLVPSTRGWAGWLLPVAFAVDVAAAAVNIAPYGLGLGSPSDNANWLAVAGALLLAMRSGPGWLRALGLARGPAMSQTIPAGRPLP
ncbi:MAG: hypothetical protein LC620_00330 [Halobacteriales archaeon]|nr:hypothetical protein [Halobacteriales archaeon]